jgi:hypothetical protein
MVLQPQQDEQRQRHRQRDQHHGSERDARQDGRAVQRPVQQPDPAARLAVGAELVQREAQAGQRVQQQHHHVQLARGGDDVGQLVQHRDHDKAGGRIQAGGIAEAPQLGKEEFDHMFNP